MLICGCSIRFPFAANVVFVVVVVVVVVVDGRSHRRSVGAHFERVYRETPSAEIAGRFTVKTSGAGQGLDFPMRVSRHLIQGYHACLPEGNFIVNVGSHTVIIEFKGHRKAKR